MKPKYVVFYYGVLSDAFQTSLQMFLSWHGKCAIAHLFLSFWSSNHAELRSGFSSSVSKSKAFGTAAHLASGNERSPGAKNCRCSGFCLEWVMKHNAPIEHIVWAGPNHLCHSPLQLIAAFICPHYEPFSRVCNCGQAAYLCHFTGAASALLSPSAVLCAMQVTSATASVCSRCTFSCAENACYTS